LASREALTGRARCAASATGGSEQWEGGEGMQITKSEVIPSAQIKKGA
jgi:hypothetical protein